MSVPPFTQPHAARVHVEIRGIVQGVGFRPFLNRLAEKYGVTGWARNTSGGVEAELEGGAEKISGFLREIRENPPPLSVVESVDAAKRDSLAGYRDFSIRPSAASADFTLISPDIALCPDCARELADPKNRRFRYPFINCTNCGPRYTIVRQLPYDRAQTSMQDFPMCPDCSREYGDIDDRRYHAQPDCCDVCGPHAFFCDASGVEQPGDPLLLAQKLLAAGGIVAVKGIGGIHLACDAENAQAVERLRRRKNRPARPLALMCRSLQEVRRICDISSEEEALLESPRRPIVLVKKKERASFSACAWGPRLGVMLPYTPLHLMLLDGTGGGPSILVMTSANRSGCPVVLENHEALQQLAQIADGFLLHNRAIVNRCDDSLVSAWQGGAYFFRRSRGYAPQPLTARQDADGICAFGAEQKASFALGRGRYIFLSPHIGDLKNWETLEHYRETLAAYRRLFRIEPAFLACDLHPDYFSTREAESLAQSRGLPLLKIQHHWAHMAACMEDNSLSGPAFGIVWDGTGLGTDGSIWGGEFLTGDFHSFSRCGSIRPIALAGGDRAVWEIGRIALSLLDDASLPSKSAPLPAEKIGAVLSMLHSGVACPKASSIGRLFDGVYALLSGTGCVSYEGEGASRLEALSPREEPDWSAPQLHEYPIVFYTQDGLRLFDTRPLVRAVAGDFYAHVPVGEIAQKFMAALCRMALEQCAALNPRRLPVVLSGGVFLNRFLLSGTTELLRREGFSVYCHKRVSTGDEGICLGQMAIAREQRRRMQNVSCHSNENYEN